METALSILLWIAPFLLGAAVAHRPWRTALGALSLALAATAAITAMMTSGERTGEILFSFQGFDGNEPGIQHYPIETVTAPAARWLWILTAWLALGGLWCFTLGRGGSRNQPHPFVYPLLFAFGNIAAILLLQKAAAPSHAHHPFPIERALVPATLAAGICMALRGRGLFTIMLQFSVFLLITRVAIAGMSWFASTRELGTSLDIHPVREVANPVNQQFLDLAANSWQQHAWLIWAPHLFLMPALYFMSLGSLVFCTYMFRRASEQPS